MKNSVLIFLSFISVLLYGQAKQSISNPNETIIYLKNRNGEIIKIQGKISAYSIDTVIIKVEVTSDSKTSVIQKIKSVCSYPLEMSKTVMDGMTGILIKYDPAVKNGNSFLYLLDEETNKLNEVKGFIKLGAHKTIVWNKNTYYYSYASCGCADNCWKSVLFNIKNYQIDSVGYLACDCENLIEINGRIKKKNITTCDDFNNNNKFEKIEAYWKNRIINGL